MFKMIGGKGQIFCFSYFDYNLNIILRILHNLIVGWSSLPSVANGILTYLIHPFSMPYNCTSQMSTEAWPAAFVATHFPHRRYHS